MENVTRKDQIVVVSENTEQYKIERVLSIKFLGVDGKQRYYGLDQLRHQIAVAEFWEGKPPAAETREQVIKRACDTLKENGMYNIFSIDYRNMLDQIEQQKKAIDALKFTIEVMSKTIEDQQATIKEYREKPEVRTVSTKEIPIWCLKITDPRDDDMKEASEVIKHFRPNFEIGKTNLQDCPDTPPPKGMSIIDAVRRFSSDGYTVGQDKKICESCNKSESQWELKDTTGSGEVYYLCSNCLSELVDLHLSPAHFTNLIRTGHKDTEFMLHSDFYDEDGNALQPRGG